MIITITLDNVITQYDNGVNNYLQNHPSPQGENIAETISQGYAQGLLKTLQPTPGVSDALWELNEQGHHIRILVNRFILHGQNHKIIAHTAEWLDTNDIPYREIYFHTLNPHLPTDIHIDADPRTIKHLIPHTTVIKYATPQNDHVNGHHTVNNWEETLQLINTINRNQTHV